MLHRCCFSLNRDGLALLDFRSRVEMDPYGAFENWDPNDDDPCGWSGVSCADGRVEMLDLKEKSLVGMLAPELGKLTHLRALILQQNNFTGVIPKEIGGLTMLELLDLRGNNLSRMLPAEIGNMLSLKCLLLCGNDFKGDTLSSVDKTSILPDLSSACEVATDLECLNRKVRYRFRSKRHSSDAHGERHGDNLSTDFIEPYIEQNTHTVRRQLLQETSNLAAVSVSSGSPQGAVTVPSIGSGSFPAVPDSDSSTKAEPSAPLNSSHSSGQIPSSPAPSKGFGIWVYVLIILGIILLLTLASTMVLMFRRRGSGTIGPWKTGLSGQLQKAFTAGVPKLNLAELEAACEEFSNIICTYQQYTMYKGTLSSGVEIAVASTAVKSATDWSEGSELCYRKKIDALSRVNHKNFVNLLGYCEENQPFMRVMVFEYAPNGTLFDHLHVKEYEPLDWSARMRVIMGIAYCLQYMHHDVKPPVAVRDLHSNSIFMTDDYAAKICDISVFNEASTKQWTSGDDKKDPTELPLDDPEGNVYSFGILMLETISGKFPYSEEGSIVDWAAGYFRGDQNFSAMVDSTLKLSNENELENICQIVQDCTDNDPKKRPTMKEVTSALREALGISPEAASPRSSPLWWAELEILSVEAS